MKLFRRLAMLFAALGVLLSHVMWAAVAYNYCDLQWGAPASTAFLLCVPYGVGIGICGALAWFFHKKRGPL